MNPHRRRVSAAHALLTPSQHIAQVKTLIPPPRALRESTSHAALSGGRVMNQRTLRHQAFNRVTFYMTRVEETDKVEREKN
ncbi:hypothetical protein CEP52_006047 [Fusarium oligoseptatum]|uniref:Uncharacterized protein n=1 Tax=Fusarium oligoseptatum TaxID=2604345 RepID=A0A428TUQ3_9HYPO|nr:hypothetical protein CEP52_006047 [Fusarium oligoseptatum]